MFWVLVFIVIGVGTALLSKRLMPGVVSDKTLWPLALGTVGAVAGGLSSLVLFDYGRAHDYLYGYTHVYESTGSTLPAHWMSPIFALVGALLVMAVYGLLRGRLPAR